MQAAGDEMLLMGDLNEHLGDSTSGMNAVVAKLGLVDSTSYHHGIEGEVATCNRSNNRLDYILCSHGIASSIWRCGVMPFNFVISSDHRGAFIDVDTDEFLGGDPSALMSANLRGI
jgi:endonuclease/exonuclease/phosphatase family metal-dependent hydrolase